MSFVKGTAATGFGIGNFINATTGATVTTGTPTCKRTIDGVAGDCANAAAYDADGLTWKINLAATDMAGDVIVLVFTLAGCLPITYTIRTVPSSDNLGVLAGLEVSGLLSTDVTGYFVLANTLYNAKPYWVSASASIYWDFDTEYWILEDNATPGGGSNTWQCDLSSPSNPCGVYQPSSESTTGIATVAARPLNCDVVRLNGAALGNESRVRRIAGSGAYQTAEMPISVSPSFRSGAVYVEAIDSLFVVYMTINAAEVFGRAIVKINLETGDIEGPVSIPSTNLTGDTHGIPSMAVLSDGRLIVTSAFHFAVDSVAKACISVRPYDITEWGDEIVLDSSTTSLTNWNNYPQFCDGPNGSIRLICGHGNSSLRTVIMLSSADGEAWNGDAPTVLQSHSVGEEYLYYHVTGQHSDGTIHMFFGRWQADGSKRDLYYMRGNNYGASWSDSAGNAITLPGGIATTEQVVDSGDEPTNFTGSGVATTPNGNPAIIYFMAGSAWFIRHTGTAWTTPVEVCDNFHVFDYSAVICDSETEYRAYLTVGENRGGELREYTSTDSGATWTHTRTIAKDVGTFITVTNADSDNRAELVFSGTRGDLNGLSVWGSNGFRMLWDTRLLMDSLGRVSPAPGSISSATLAADAISSDAMSSEAVSKIVDAVDSESEILGQIAADVAGLDGEAMRGTDSAVTSNSVFDTFTFTQIITSLLATMAGKVSLTENGDGTYTAIFKKQDGDATALSVTYTGTTGERENTGVVS